MNDKTTDYLQQMGASQVDIQLNERIDELSAQVNLLEKALISLMIQLKIDAFWIDENGTLRLFSAWNEAIKRKIICS